MAQIIVEAACRLCDHWAPSRTADGVLFGVCRATDYQPKGTAALKPAWVVTKDNEIPVRTMPDHYCSMFRNNTGRR